jgi:hypothetical protein
LFRLVSAYSLSQNIIESAETSQLFHQPNQPDVSNWLLPGLLREARAGLIGNVDPNAREAAQFTLQKKKIVRVNTWPVSPLVGAQALP